jgi:hypothetical protein
MQRIRVVLETATGSPSSSLSSEFRNKLRPHYKGVHLDVTVNESPDEFGTDSLLDLARDVASKAEEDQRGTHADFAAYLRPVTQIFESGQSGEENELAVVLIAVAHEGGIGALVIAKAIPLTSIPVLAALKLLERVNKVTDVMRPRTDHEAHEEAARLGTLLGLIIEDIVARS